MTSRRLFRWFVSARTTVALLCLLGLLLLLNVLLPQEVVLGKERFAALLDNGGPPTRFLLATLGLGRMATSPVFLAVLGLFLLNLATVLAARVRPTWHRIALKRRSEEGLKRWARMEETCAAPLPEGWKAGDAARILRGFGYQVRRPGKTTFWAVKHRTAPLGFLLFHLSFFLLCGGGVLIYYTRFVGVALLSEGQHFAGEYSDVLREAPTGRRPQLSFLLQEAQADLVGGLPVHLEARFQIMQSGGWVEKRSRVNHPAGWKDIILLVQRAGLAPVLWLQDSRGFTVDRVAIPARTRGGPPTEVPLADGTLEVLIHPLSILDEFPDRDRLPATKLRFQIREAGEPVFDDQLSPGQAARLPSGRLVFEELRYWVELKVIAERGGGLLIAGFVIGLIGLVWRLLWYRREVAITWEEATLRLVGRSEYFSDRFSNELRALFEMIQQSSAGAETSVVPPDQDRGKTPEVKSP